MDSEESLLKPCKSLPPLFRDHDALQNRINPHLGSVSSTQGEMAQDSSTPAKDIEEGGYVTHKDGGIQQEERTLIQDKAKKPELAVNKKKEGPLNLLDLPLDILKDIFKEVSARSKWRRLWADSPSRSHIRAIYVVLPPRILLCIRSLLL